MSATCPCTDFGFGSIVNGDRQWGGAVMESHLIHLLYEDEDGKSHRMSLRLQPTSATVAIDAAVRCRFNIPDDFRLLLWDSDGTSVPLDSGLPADTYELSVCRNPVREGLVEVKRNTRSTFLLDAKSNLFMSKKKVNLQRRKVIMDFLQEEMKYCERLSTAETLYIHGNEDLLECSQALAVIAPLGLFGNLPALRERTQEFLDLLKVQNKPQPPLPSKTKTTKKGKGSLSYTTLFVLCYCMHSYCELYSLTGYH